MHNLKKIIVLLFIIATGCREKYVPDVSQPLTGFLVVDGFINSGAGPTTIVLSRTTKLSNGALQYETKAKVSVEGKLNTALVLLTETSKPGTYSIAQLNLNPADQYRLRIVTLNGREYVSEYSTVRRTPDIDSISFKQENDGLHIYGNTHNTQEPVGYYKWSYDETHEIHSQYKTRLKLYLNPVTREQDHFGYRDSTTFSDDLSMYFCWKSDTAKKILVTSTEKLGANLLSEYEIRFIKSNERELAVRYSIQAQMYSISRGNMLFLEQLRKNTELLGSIFDAQPSDNMGNMRCTSNPSEIVLGYMEVSELKQKRIFINRSQLKDWHYQNGCAGERTIANSPKKFLLDGGDEPTQVALFYINSPQIDSVFVASRHCVDCRLSGTNVRPSFW